MYIGILYIIFVIFQCLKLFQNKKFKQKARLEKPRYLELGIIGEFLKRAQTGMVAVLYFLLIFKQKILLLQLVRLKQTQGNVACQFPPYNHREHSQVLSKFNISLLKLFKSHSFPIPIHQYNFFNLNNIFHVISVNQ